MTCPFCERIASGDRITHENELAVAFADGFPLSSGHTLVVPKRHITRLAQDAAAWSASFELAREVAETLGCDFNVGLNAGVAAGQTIDHAHVHVIPRKAGDVPDPRGGVRWVLPELADYWRPR